MTDGSASILCDACGLPPVAGASPGDASGLPGGWFRRTFGRRSFVLCDCCGSIHQFKGGVSAYLQEALGLGPNAMPDFEADQTPGSGLHRLRIQSATDATGDDASPAEPPPGDTR